ncbi:hypothetical protein D3C81_2124780 [compost metagenome]
MGFHALGDHLKVEALGHGDDCPGDRGIFTAFAQAADKGLIDLHVIHREALEVAER